MPSLDTLFENIEIWTTSSEDELERCLHDAGFIQSELYDYQHPDLEGTTVNAFTYDKIDDGEDIFFLGRHHGLEIRDFLVADRITKCFHVPVLKAHVEHVLTTLESQGVGYLVRGAIKEGSIPVPLYVNNTVERKNIVPTDIPVVLRPTDMYFD